MRWWLGALVLLALSLVLRLEYVVYAVYVFLGVLGVSWHAARRWTGWLAAARRCSMVAGEIGDRATVTVALRNAGRGRIPWLLLEESLPRATLQEDPPRLRTTARPVEVASLRAGEARVIRYEVEFLKRGYYTFGPVLAESGDLFGLHRRYRIVSEPCHVLVRPRVVPLTGYDLASRRPVGEVRIRHRLFEDPTRIAGVRPYEKGDPLNRIHWRATARTGALHSKVCEPSCVAGATLVLDFHRASFPGRRAADAQAELARRLKAAGLEDRVPDPHAPDTAWVELAVTTIASIASALAELGEKVGLVTNGRDAAERVRTEGWAGEFRTRTVARRKLLRPGVNDRLQPVVIGTRRDPSPLPEILDTLGRLELTDGLPMSELLAEAAGHLPRDATLAVVLARVDEAAALALGRMRRRGFAVSVILVDPAEPGLHDWAGAPDWAARLMAEGLEFRLVRDEADLAHLCAEHFVR
ncbi:MAG: DUF58 domain-containing protein [Verrucomicrobiales bacterium]|nr:DUF58 domain-containing protein [Verrucomicrobiales bacterium]